MDVNIKRVGHRDGQDRFVLVDAKTRKIVSVNDVSEDALRRFFAKRGVDPELLNECLSKARKQHSELTASKPAANHAADTAEDNDLLFELGLTDDGGTESR